MYSQKNQFYHSLPRKYRIKRIINPSPPILATKILIIVPEFNVFGVGDGLGDGLGVGLGVGDGLGDGVGPTGDGVGDGVGPTGDGVGDGVGPTGDGVGGSAKEICHDGNLFPVCCTA